MRKTAYVQGSTARELEREELERRVLEGGAQKNKQGLTFMNMLLLVVLGAVLVAGFLQFIHLTSEIAVAREKYTKAYAEYEALKDDNDNIEEAIQNDINMEEIRRIATEELGMKLPGEGQVVTYSPDIDDYVEQYADITPR